MTRPLTKRELASVAASSVLLAEQKTFVSSYLIASLGLGIMLSAILAGLMLLTDALGLFSLVLRDRSPVGAIITLILTSVFAFTPIIFAIGVGLLGSRSNKVAASAKWASQPNGESPTVLDG